MTSGPFVWPTAGASWCPERQLLSTAGVFRDLDLVDISCIFKNQPQFIYLLRTGSRIDGAKAATGASRWSVPYYSAMMYAYSGRRLLA